MAATYSCNPRKKGRLQIRDDASDVGYTVQGSGFNGNIITDQKLNLPLENKVVDYGFASSGMDMERKMAEVRR